MSEQAEQRRQSPGVFSGRHVDDGAPAAEGLHDLHHPKVAFGKVGASLHVIADLGSVGGSDQCFRIRQLEKLGHVIQDPARGGGGGRQGGKPPSGGGCGDSLGDQGVFGPKRMAPHRYAVGFVDGDPLHIYLAEPRPKGRTPQPFRADVEELDMAIFGRFEYVALLGLPDTGVDGGRFGDSLAPQVVDLISHQRHQRRDHQRHPW